MSRKTDTTVVARTIGIDTGKNTLHLIGLDDKGAIVLREKLTRGRIAARLANVPQCLIGIEAGMATHCVARELIALGHDVKQVPPVYARPFRQGHKNDFRDAHAIAEAVQPPSTRCVPVKTDDQLDLQALHRVRSRLISERTAVICPNDTRPISSNKPKKIKPRTDAIVGPLTHAQRGPRCRNHNWRTAPNGQENREF